MYGTYWGTFYTSLLTSLGGVFCYLLSAPLAPLITSLPGLNKPLNAMRRALAPARARSGGKKTGGNIWTYLLVLRILPIVPYGLMNIACGVLAVPLLPYAATLAVGSIPWNFVTCQVGDILQDIVVALPLDGQSDGVFEAEGMPTNVGASGGGVRAIVERVWNREMMVKLVLLSLASALPMLLQRYLKANRPAENEDEAMAPLAGDDEENERMLERNHDGPPSWATNLEMRRPALADGDESFRQGHVREVTDPSWQDFRQSQSQISYDDIAHGSISGRFPPPERAMQRAVFA